jgi:hypothetical protein
MVFSKEVLQLLNQENKHTMAGAIDRVAISKTSPVPIWEP